MSDRSDLLTGVGRLIMGSLYEPKTVDSKGNPLLVKSGVNLGKPRFEYFFAIAIPKGSEQHWASTTWGSQIWQAGHKFYPNHAASPNFIWKVKDGDSAIPNNEGNKLCDRAGCAGCWIVYFSSANAPKIWDHRNQKYIYEKDVIDWGDYIQVSGNMVANGALPHPGIFINHHVVAFIGFGERIPRGVDPRTIAFSNDLPIGAQLTPPAASNLDVIDKNLGMPATITAPPAPPTLNTVAPPPSYPQILTPPPAPTPIAPPARVMLPGAKGATYEQLTAAGWTDAQLIQHKMMAG